MNHGLNIFVRDLLQLWEKSNRINGDLSLQSLLILHLYRFPISHTFQPKLLSEPATMVSNKSSGLVLYYNDSTTLLPLLYIILHTQLRPQRLFPPTPHPPSPNGLGNTSL
jgi:hypothetical protein